MTEQVECNCAWNPDRHADTCPVYMQQQIETLQQQVEAMRGLVPDMPPRPPEGEGLPRYGLRWNGPGQPLSVPMDDGYWTPWHLAEHLHQQVKVLRQHKNDYMESAEGTRKALEAEIVELKAMLASRHPFEQLAADHKGMRVDYSGLLKQSCRALRVGTKDLGLAELLSQLHGHMTELGQRWYRGDTAVVDELLQLYAVEDGARDALKKAQGGDK